MQLIRLATKLVLSNFRRYLKIRRFREPEERLFRQFYADKAYPRARFGVIFGFFAWASFGVWDSLGFPKLLPELAAIRFGAVAPILGWLGWFIVSRPKQFKARMQYFLFTAGAVAGCGLYLMMLLVQEEDPNKAFQQYWPTFSSLYFFIYAFLGMRLASAAIIGIVSFGLVCLAGCRDGVQNTSFGVALLQLAILNILGMIICARMEIQERTLFRLRQHRLRLSRTARVERQNARESRDETLLENARAEAALMLARIERKKLAAAIADKERFLSAAYHDLQQPLSTIGLYVRLAKNKLEQSPASALQSDINVIGDAAQDIALMFKGVRDAWEIGRSQPHIEAVNIDAILVEIERELRERVEQKGLDFRIRKSMRPCHWVRSDRTLLKRAISNLASNAIKYTERGGVLVGSIGLQSSVRIDVWDTGIGIPAEFQDRIFDEYFQVGNTSADYKQGLGIGLSIVRRIEENLPGHTLKFFSKPGRGSRFSLYLPFVNEYGTELTANLATSRTPALGYGLEGKYIVIVEDEPSNLEGMIQTIGSAGCIVEGVDGVEAASRLFAERERCPDILVTDFQLRHGQTGLDAIAALRERFEWAQQVPVLFVTGELLLDAKLVDFKGSYDIHYKPIEPENLLAKLSELLKLHPA